MLFFVNIRINRLDNINLLQSTQLLWKCAGLPDCQ